MYLNPFLTIMQTTQNNVYRNSTVCYSVLFRFPKLPESELFVSPYIQCWRRFSQGWQSQADSFRISMTLVYKSWIVHRCLPVACVIYMPAWSARFGCNFICTPNLYKISARLYFWDMHALRTRTHNIVGKVFCFLK